MSFRVCECTLHLYTCFSMDKKIVSAIWIYPVKSLGGIQLSTVNVLAKGLDHDRRWMLINEQNKCMTQRDYPAMALFKLFFDGPGLVIRYEDQSMDLPFTYEKDPFPATIWNDQVSVYEVSRQHSEWFSLRLGVKCRLVAFPDENPRPVDPLYSIHNDHVSLADGYPLLIIGQRSLDDLNDRLEIPLPMNRFRPNIVFTGGKPYEEDTWKNFRIGQSRFAGVKLCARCVLTSVDQDKGIKTGVEPMATLATYRKEGNNVYFGQNLLVLDAYEVAVGDEIILE
jgi:uncharacterized protein